MHRLEQILQYDMVALLGDGTLLEYDQPKVLLEQESMFAELYKISTRGLPPDPTGQKAGFGHT